MDGNFCASISIMRVLGHQLKAIKLVTTS